MELLNLDELASAIKRQVTLKGKTYDLAERQVGQMIASIQRVKEFEKIKEDEKGGTIEASELLTINLVDSAQELLPDCPRDILNSCSMQQLSALLDFANESDSEVIEDAKIVEITEAKEAKEAKATEDEGSASAQKK